MARSLQTMIAVTASEPTGEPERCHHCGQPVPAGSRHEAVIGGQPRPMCCAGCAVVAEIIAGADLGAYYRLRTESPPTPPTPRPDARRWLAGYDHPAAQRGIVRASPRGGVEASLAIGGIRCSACAWLVEQRLRSLAGVQEALVNFATHRATVRWDPDAVALSDVLAAVHELGYGAHPYDPQTQEAALDAERRGRLRRLAVSALLAMQVMMASVALYAGDAWGITPGLRDLLRWAALALCAPLVAYGALPFLRGAARDLRNRRPGMDVPVALGICVAFGASAAATFRGAGEVYFDSVAMFVTLLLLARYLEFLARRRHARLAETCALEPLLAARRIPDAAPHEEVVVPASELAAGDRVRVRPGETVPADGVVDAGRSSVDEALLTGESRPVSKAPGDRVLAGSENFESPLEIRVERTGGDTVRGRLLSVVERARAERPSVSRLADLVATWFVTAVLALAAAVAWWWLQIDPDRWVEVTVALLVATCPCALSLATPTAVTAAITALAARGVVAARADALATLARVDHVLVDKTGTLTAGRPELTEVLVADGVREDEALALAAALERHAGHPAADAIVAAAAARGLPRHAASDVRSEPGRGIEGEVAGARYRVGAPDATGAAGGDPVLAAAEAPRLADCSIAVLSGGGRTLAAFALRDALRPDARAAVAGLRGAGVAVSLCSGDRAGAVAAVAEQLGIEAGSGMSPHDKRERLAALQGRGAVVAALGDGVNDAPLLGRADVSVAMGDGARALRAGADLILLGGRPSELAAAIRVARRARAVVAENLAWAIGYNLLVLPAAAAGLVPPWAAALGMSASSLVVVANSLRSGRAPPREED